MLGTWPARYVTWDELSLLSILRPLQMTLDLYSYVGDLYALP